MKVSVFISEFKRLAFMVSLFYYNMAAISLR